MLLLLAGKSHHSINNVHDLEFKNLSDFWKISEIFSEIFKEFEDFLDLMRFGQFSRFAKIFKIMRGFQEFESVLRFRRIFKILKEFSKECMRTTMGFWGSFRDFGL